MYLFVVKELIQLKIQNKVGVIAGLILCIFAGIKLTPIAGLILTPVRVGTVVSVVWYGGVENGMQYDGEENEHKVNSQATGHIKEQCEEVYENRIERKVEQEGGIEACSI